MRVSSDSKQTIKLYRNDEKCSACEKPCCSIYLSSMEGGTRNPNVWFDEWCLDFHANSRHYGVEPLFDPLVVHMSGNERMLDELRARGIDPHSCEYLSKNGCSIPWDNRPNQCREWSCERFEESDYVEVL